MCIVPPATRQRAGEDFDGGAQGAGMPLADPARRGRPLPAASGSSEERLEPAGQVPRSHAAALGDPSLGADPVSLRPFRRADRNVGPLPFNIEGRADTWVRRHA